MRRGRDGPLRGGRRFLRSRGDAPARARPGPCPRGVPPLTRRCASDASLRGQGPRGSSAHAEMRPTPLSVYSPVMRFLRSRGDAPPTTPGASRRWRVPPLTRRCALSSLPADELRPGSSAHAEMRPGLPCVDPCPARFLRSRGDAPSTGGRLVTPPLVPPLTRRCAPLGGFARGRGGGSSAHAEMRPPVIVWPTAAFWFLRSRGDAPVMTAGDSLIAGVPPLTRRCAAGGRPDLPRGPGSSAHAEMRRSARSASTWIPWFLRSRGDAPVDVGETIGSAMVPPLTRRCAPSRSTEP